MTEEKTPTRSQVYKAKQAKNEKNFENNIIAEYTKAVAAVANIKNKVKIQKNITKPTIDLLRKIKTEKEFIEKFSTQPDNLPRSTVDRLKVLFEDFDEKKEKLMINRIDTLWFECEIHENNFNYFENNNDVFKMKANLNKLKSVFDKIKKRKLGKIKTVESANTYAVESVNINGIVKPFDRNDSAKRRNSEATQNAVSKLISGGTPLNKTLKFYQGIARARGVPYSGLSKAKLIHALKASPTKKHSRTL